MVSLEDFIKHINLLKRNNYKYVLKVKDSNAINLILCKSKDEKKLMINQLKICFNDIKDYNINEYKKLCKTIKDKNIILRDNYYLRLRFY